MSRGMALLTGKTPGHDSSRTDGNLSIATQQPTPRFEHQYPQRPIQLKDLKKYSRHGEDLEPGCLPSSWMGGLRDKRRRKKVDQTWEHSEDARQKVAEVANTSKSPHSSSAFASEELAGLPQRPLVTPTHPSTIPPPSPRTPKPLHGCKPALQHAVLRKSVFKYRDVQGVVPRHSVRITPSALQRRSVHLVRTRSDNYRIPSEPKSPRTRNASRVTRFDDFISQEAFSEQLPQSSTPSPLPKETYRGSIVPQHPRRGTLWDFPGISALHSPIMDSTKYIPKGNLSQDQIRHGMCGICGTPNSPHTRYGDQGLWLCTACRSPTSAIELPPRITSMANTERHRQRPAVENLHSAKPPSESCSYCHTSLPLVFRDQALFCSWCCKEKNYPLSAGVPSRDSNRLTLLRVRRQKAAVSISTKGAEEEWEDFDSDMSQGSKTTSPPPRISEKRPSNRMGAQNDHWQKARNGFTPTPPLKDSIYLSRKTYNPASPGTFATSPVAKHPPLPATPGSRKAAPQAVRTIDRETFHASTLTSTPPPDLPPHPTKTNLQEQKHPRPHRTSSIYPPTPQFTPSDFPYPPPPIPTDHTDIRRALRASSVYTVDVSDKIPRLRTPDWQLDSPNRDTTFYGFWETILRDDGTTFRDV